MNKNAKDSREKEKQQFKDLIATGLSDIQPLYGEINRKNRFRVYKVICGWKQLRREVQATESANELSDPPPTH